MHFGVSFAPFKELENLWFSMVEKHDFDLGPGSLTSYHELLPSTQACTNSEARVPRSQGSDSP